MSSVLFLCTGNSARSQLAEAQFKHLSRHFGENRFQVFSAGTQPQTVDERVYQVLKSRGIPASNLRSKTIEELDQPSFDYVITLCDNAKDECSRYPVSSALIHWNLADPKLSKGLAPFEDTYDELDEHIRLFLKLNTSDPVTPLDSPPDNPTDLFKILSNNTRLRILMLIEDEKELCVSELTEAMQEIQPKISRHLAQMRALKILSIRRQAQMIYYRLSDDLPVWVTTVLATIRNGNTSFINQEKIRLKAMRQNSP